MVHIISMSPMLKTRRSGGLILLVFAILAAASFLVCIDNKVAIVSWSRIKVLQPLIGREGANSYDDHSKHEATTIASGSTRRMLATKRPDMNETQLQHQMRSYLGGLYPPVDRNMVPMYLKDTLDTEEIYHLDLTHVSGQPVMRSGQPVMRNRDLVFFWHIPKASGSTMKNIMNFCFDLRRAEQVEEPPSLTYVRNNVLNIDTSSPDGLAFAFANQLVNSKMVDVVVSNYFLSASALFNDQHKGKTFTILRHPVDIALSLFHYRRRAKWERSFRKDWMKLSFHEYIESDNYMDSWMTRQLTGTMPWVELDGSHLERAKLIMKEKIFVGVMSEMDETIRQLKAHFGWEDKEEKCSKNFIHSTPANENKHPGLQGGRGGKSWNVLAEKEKWDFSLYHYGLELFAEQRERYPPEPKE